MIVYKITNSVNNKIYIGQTSRSLVKRWEEHIKESSYRKSKFYNAIKKYGHHSFTIHIICYANSLEELNHREKYCIRVFKAIENGYNSQLGGKDHTLTKEVKTKISIAIKQLQLKPWLGKNLSKETKNKISFTKKRLKHSVGVYNPMYGKKHALSSVIKNAISNGSKEFVVYKDSVIIGRWLIKSECARYLGISRHQVKDCLNGRFKSACGYTFKYVENSKDV